MQPAAAVGIDLVETALLAERHLRRHVARRRLVEGADIVALGAPDVPAVQRILERLAVHRRKLAIDQIGPVEFAENGHHAAGAVNVLQMHVRHRGRHLAQHRHPARQPVDVLHREGDLAFVGRRQQMQHGVGRSAHRDVQRHGIFERLEAGDRPRQRGLVVLFIVAARQIDDQMAGLDEQSLAVGMRRQHRAVAGQAQGRAPRSGSSWSSP